MNYRIKPIRGVPDRMYAFREGSESPIGSFKDYHNGTVYTSVKHPKGEIDFVAVRSQDNKSYDKLFHFLRLIDGQKIPNVPFRVIFTVKNLTEEGFKEFKEIVFPNKSKIKKEKTRQYYLKKKINKITGARVSSTDNCVYVTDFEMTGIPDKIRALVFELRDKHRYSIQQEIPCPKMKDSEILQPSES